MSEPGILEIKTTIDAWRALALLAHSVIHGRSNDWAGLREAREKTDTLPIVGMDSLCRDLAKLCARIAVENDWRRLYDDVDDHVRRLLARLEQVELGLDVLRDLMARTDEVAA